MAELRDVNSIVRKKLRFFFSFFIFHSVVETNIYKIGTCMSMVV